MLNAGAEFFGVSSSLETGDTSEQALGGSPLEVGLTRKRTRIQYITE
jgi:hypothetical protein